MRTPRRIGLFACICVWIAITADIVHAGIQNDMVNAQDNEGNTPTHVAVQYDRMEIAELLVQYANADVNIQNEKGQTPLHMTIDYHRVKIMKLMTREGADLSLQDENGNTALHLALLKDIANSTENENEIEPKCNAKFSKRSIDEQSYAYMACYLVVQGADLNIRNNDGQSPLNFCRKLRSCDKTNQIYRNWDIDTKNGQGNTALQICAELNRTEIALLLVEHGADMDLRNFGKLQTALHIATDLRHVEIVKILVSHGCNLTLPDINGNTALHLAVNNYISELQDHPQDVHLCDREAKIRISDLEGNSYIACYLVKNGADLNAKNRKDESPIGLCPGLRRCIRRTNES